MLDSADLQQRFSVVERDLEKQPLPDRRVYQRFRRCDAFEMRHIEPADCRHRARELPELAQFDETPSTPVSSVRIQALENTKPLARITWKSGDPSHQRPPERFHFGSRLAPHAYFMPFFAALIQAGFSFEIFL